VVVIFSRGFFLKGFFKPFETSNDRNRQMDVIGLSSPDRGVDGDLFLDDWHDDDWKNELIEFFGTFSFRKECLLCNVD
jgi:hypothetical protein